MLTQNTGLVRIYVKIDYVVSGELAVDIQYGIYRHTIIF